MSNISIIELRQKERNKLNIRITGFHTLQVAPTKCWERINTSPVLCMVFHALSNSAIFFFQVVPPKTRNMIGGKSNSNADALDFLVNHSEQTDHYHWNSLTTNLMHWLHVRPNSEFPENRHFFGRFLSFYRQIFCRFFSAKFKRRIGIRHTFGFFSPFLSLSANFRILENRIWQIFGLFARHLAKFSEKLRRKKSFFSDFGGEFWVKNCQKPAYKVPNWRKIGIRPHV